MKNNKGFSLVELIIVIAIMAILVGVMAPQLIKYIEKTKVSSDVQLCDTVRSAVVTAAMDPEVVKKGGGLESSKDVDITAGGWYTNGSGSDGTDFDKVVEEILGKTIANIPAELKSKGAKTVKIKTGSTANNVLVYVGENTDIFAGATN